MSNPEPALYIPSERYKWITYLEEGQEDDPVQCEVKVRKNLTNEELETLTFETLSSELFLKDADGNDLAGEALDEGRQRLMDARAQQEAEVREALAPYVVDWNMGYRTPSGEAVKADPPAIAGGEQFGKFLSDRIVNQIYLDLRLRSTGLVKAKSSKPLTLTVATTDDSPSTPTGTPSA